MYRTENIFRIRQGKDFEDEFCALLLDGIGSGVKDCRNTKRDICQGTDFVLYGVPTDVTLYVFGKDNTKVLGKKELMYGDILFGVRTGNDFMGSFHEFDTPVLVIGANISHEAYRYYGARLLDEIKKNLSGIIDDAMDCYWQYMDGVELA